MLLKYNKNFLHCVMLKYYKYTKYDKNFLHCVLLKNYMVLLPRWKRIYNIYSIYSISASRSAKILNDYL